ncbi:MAG: MarR family transcriptional regulator [Pseudomonadota bacterium]|nr:MarR family transcriptional regulator [Pseudomonadota bacterium]
MADSLKEKLKSFSLNNAPGHLIRRSQQRAVDLFVDEVGENGPNPRQFSVLLNVFQNPGMSQTALVEASGIDRSTLTEVLRRMIDRGMISKSRTKEDQRANALIITNAGLKLLEDAYEATVRAQRNILAPLSAADRKLAIKVLTALAGFGNKPGEDP